MDLDRASEINSTLQNLVRHLKFYFKKNNISALQVSKVIGISNQNMYNILDTSTYPAINTIVKICNIFNCSAPEILSPELFLDIPIYNSLSDYQDRNIKRYRRVFFPIKYENILYNDLFIIEHTFNKSDFIKFFNLAETQLPCEYGHLLYKYDNDISSTGGTGKYIASISNKLTGIDIYSISGDKAKIKIQQQKSITNIESTKIKLLYKYVALISLTDYSEDYFKSAPISDKNII